jgi:hypothetical protein
MISNQEIQRIVDSITEGLEEPTGKGWPLNEAATCCVFWCIVHKAWRYGADLGMTKKSAIKQLHNGPLARRSIGAIEPKVMNVTSAAQRLLEKGMPIYNEGRYAKRGTGEDMGPKAPDHRGLKLATTLKIEGVEKGLDLAVLAAAVDSVGGEMVMLFQDQFWLIQHSEKNYWLVWSRLL